MTRRIGILALITTVILILMMNQLVEGETAFAQLFIGLLIAASGLTSFIWLLTEIMDYGYSYPTTNYSVYTPPTTTSKTSRKSIEGKIIPRTNIPQIEGKMLKVDSVESETILHNPIEVNKPQLPTLNELKEKSTKTIDEPTSKEVLGDEVIMIHNSDVLNANQQKIYDAIIRYLNLQSTKSKLFIQEKIKQIEFIDIINSFTSVIYVKNLKHFMIQHELRKYIKNSTSFSKIEFAEYNHIKLEDYYNKQQNSDGRK